MIAQSNLSSFNPSGIGIDNGNFLGLPFTYETAQTILIGVPWEVTVSYGAGTAEGPQRVLDASRQLDIYDWDAPDAWQQGLFMVEISPEIRTTNRMLRQQAAQIIEYLEQGKSVETNSEIAQLQQQINRECETVNQWLFEQTQTALQQGKRVGIIGGDHSTPLGYMQALAKQYSSYGVLHVDAHADLRNAYEGFQYSHASIMYNATQIPEITKLVQVGVRDFCHDEVALIQQSGGRIVSHFDPALKQKLYAGVSWLNLCQEVVADLPQQVYISFDVDGLDPKLCPHTGTPVPGGLELEQAFCLIREVVNSGRTIIGFDVSEVGDSEWDGNVGARIVYKLCNLMTLSQSR